MKSIKEKAEEYTSDITNPVTNNAAFLAHKTGANYVLEEIEKLIYKKQAKGNLSLFDLTYLIDKLKEK